MKQLNISHPIGVSGIKVHVTDQEGATLPFLPTLEQVTYAYTQAVLERLNIEAASRALGISREKVYRMIKKAEMNTPRKGKQRVEAK